MQETSSLAAQAALKASQSVTASRQVDSDVQREEMRQQAACAAWILQHGRPSSFGHGSASLCSIHSRVRVRTFKPMSLTPLDGGGWRNMQIRQGKDKTWAAIAAEKHLACSDAHQLALLMPDVSLE